MPRNTDSTAPATDEQFRISFLLDIRRYPELAYLRDLTGHGDRPREIMRLAVLGQRHEAEMQEIAELTRKASMAALRGTAARTAEEASALLMQAVRRTDAHDAAAQPPARPAKPTAARRAPEPESQPVAAAEAPEPAPAPPAAELTAAHDVDVDEEASPAASVSSTPADETPAAPSGPTPKSNPKAATIARGLLA